MLDAIGALGAAHATATPALEPGGARRARSRRGCASSCCRSRRRTTSPAHRPVAYPDGDDDFPTRLAGLAAMLAAGLPIRCAALTAPGDVRHPRRPAEELAKGLKLTADSLLAFQRDLEARGLADRVLVHVWSEFGRRAQENGSDGTDHGAAGVGFLIGTRVNGTMIGEFPACEARRGRQPARDLRLPRVYCALLEQWLGIDAAAIIPGARVRPPALIR